MQTTIAQTAQTQVAAPYAVAATERGTSSGRVSSEWFNRPDDQRFTSLDELHSFTKQAADESRAAILDVRDIRIGADRADPDTLRFEFPEQRGFASQDASTAPNHWSFGQTCALLSAPASYLRKLPAPITAINLQYALQNFREETVKAYIRENGKTELRAMTGPKYGRIHDHAIVDAVRGYTTNDVGNWKIPGVMDWRTMEYNPLAPVTKDSTTLFASDRDIFMFLVDDLHPIKIGTFERGGVVHDDLVFRGFYVWNSEVGSKSFGLAAFYLRGVCMNRCLWGIENFSELTFRHSSQAPARFMRECMPALESFSTGQTQTLVAGVQAAKAAIVAKDDTERREFLHRRGFTQKDTTAILDSVLAEEGHPAESVWDMVQGITATARSVGRTDDRLAMERQAGKILDKVKL